MGKRLALLGLLGLLWGSLTPLAKLVAAAGVPPLAYAMVVMLSAGTLLLLVCLARGRRLPTDGLSLRYYGVCGLIGSAAPTANMFHVLSEVPAGLMAIIISTSPLITYLLALAARMERFASMRAAGLMLGLAGVALILLPRASLPSGDMAPFVLLAFATPALYATNTVYASKYRPTGVDSLALASGMLLSAGALLTVAAAAVGQLPQPAGYAMTANLLILSHAVLTALAFTIFFVLLNTAGPVFVSQVGYIVTLVGVGIGMVFLGESHSHYVWLAMALIFGGLALVTWRPARK